MARSLLPRARTRFRRVRTGSLRPAGLIRRHRTRGPWLLLVVATAVTLPSPVLGAGAPDAGAAGLMRPPTVSNVPATALRAYRYAESWAQGFDPTCKLSWSVLAGIGRIESNHGRYYGAAARFSPTGDVTPTILGPVLNGAPNTATIHDSDGGRLDGDTLWDRAVGPMQFIPSTWQALARDGNGDDIANPNNLFDAAVTAAAYLCQSGGGTLAEQANLRSAIYAYNHSWDYVAAVLSWANFYQQQAGQGSLVQVQVPNGPSSTIQPGVAASGTGVAPSSGSPGSSSVPTTRGVPRASRPSAPTSSTRPRVTQPATTPTTARPPTTTDPCRQSDGDSSCRSGDDSSGGGSGGSGSGSGSGGSGSSGSSGDGGSGGSGSSGSSGSGDGGSSGSASSGSGDGSGSGSGGRG